MTTLSLRCLLSVDKPGKIFTVEIERTKDVSILKKKIKQEAALSLAAKDLILWNVNLPLKGLDTRLPSLKHRMYPTLSPSTTKLSSFFHDTRDDCLHILVQLPLDIPSTLFSQSTQLLLIRCLLSGDSSAKIFTVKILATEDISILKDTIKKKVPISLANVEAKDLNLLNVNLPLEDLDSELDPLDHDMYSSLSPPTTKLSSFFPETLADSDRLHILVKWTPATSLSTRRGLSSNKEEEDLISQREKIVTEARNRDSPSAGAKNSTLIETQKQDRIDALYNGRPLNLTAPSVSIYHPVFAKFRQEIARPINKMSFTNEELAKTLDLITNSVAFYKSKDARIDRINDAMRALVDNYVLYKTEIKGHGNTFKPDGLISYECKKFPDKDLAACGFTEVKNGSIGEGGSDPIHQAQCDYVAYYSSQKSNPIRNASCCPAFLIGIAGPYMIISGAVFTERFISQPLTDYIFLGGTPQLNERIYEIANILRALKLCLGELDRFYADLDPNPPLPRRGKKKKSDRLQSARTTSSLFPHFRSFNLRGDEVQLEYVERLVPQHSEKAVFKAIAQRSGQKSSVVVKFTRVYCPRAHVIAHSKNSAPRLWFCEKVESVGMFVVVMDFVEGQCLDDQTILSEEVVETLRDTISTLHHEGMVYGDLRPPNIILAEDGQGGKRAMLLDFDWAGEAGVTLYPADINLDSATWHEDVKPGRPVFPEHDLFMLDHLGSGDDEYECIEDICIL